MSAENRTVPLPPLIYVLTAGTFLMGTSEFVVAGLLPELSVDFGVSVAAAGLAISVFAIGMIVGAPVMALATLRLSPRWTLTAALVVFAGGHLAAAMTSSFEVMLAARVITAAATGAFWAVASVVAARAAGQAGAARALGVVLGGGMLANVLGVPVGSLAGQLVGWRGTFIGLVVLAAATAVIVASLVPASVGNPRSQAPSVRAELAVLKSGRLWLTLGVCACVTGGVLSVYSYIAPILTQRAGAGPGLIPVALMLFGLAALIGSVLSGRLGDRRPFAVMFTTAALTLLSITLLLLMADSSAVALVLFTMLGLSGLAANPVLVSFAVRFGGTSPTLAAAMPTSIFNLGTATGTAASARLLDSGWSTSGPLLVGFTSAMIIFIPLTALAMITRQPQRPVAAAERSTAVHT